MNRYIYCVTSPLNYIDPSGHTKVTDVLLSAGISDLWNPKLPEPPIGYDVYLNTPSMRRLTPIAISEKYLNIIEAIDNMKPSYSSGCPLNNMIDSVKEKSQIAICEIAGSGDRFMYDLEKEGLPSTDFVTLEFLTKTDFSD